MIPIWPDFPNVPTHKLGKLAFARNGISWGRKDIADGIIRHAHRLGNMRKRAKFLPDFRLQILNVHFPWLSCHNSNLSQQSRPHRLSFLVQQHGGSPRITTPEIYP